VLRATNNRGRGEKHGVRRQLGTGWRTVWESIRPILATAAADESRFEGVTVLGVDEHVVRHEALVSDGGERPTSLGRRSGWVKLAAVCPRGTPGVDGSSRDRIRAVRHKRTGRAW